jgi:hypothetical protein
LGCAQTPRQSLRSVLQSKTFLTDFFRKSRSIFYERRIAIKKSMTRLTTIGKQKYKVVSHYVGEKDINKVLEELAVRRALFEYNYDGGFKKAV